MATISLNPLLRHHGRRETPKFAVFSNNAKPPPYSSLNNSYCSNAWWRKRPLSNGARLKNFSSRAFEVRASSGDATVVIQTFDSTDILFNQTFPLRHIEKVEGKVLVQLEKGQDEENWQLTVGCNLPGKWVLHWGVNYVNDIGSEWDQPPLEMRPPESIPIKEYAVETPLEKLSTASDDDPFHQVQIQFNTNSLLTAINFVLKDEETGSWYQHRGRDFKVPLVDISDDDDGITVGSKKGFPLWSGTLGQLSNMLLKSEGARPTGEVGSSKLAEPIKQKRCLQAFSEEYSIVKEICVDNSVSVSIKRCLETASNILCIDTDLSGDVIVHWGVCKDESKRWEIPAEPYPPQTIVFKNKALRTQLQKKEGAVGCSGLFALDERFMGFLFVLKLNDSTWLNYMGNDFYVPIPSVSGIRSQSRQDLTVGEGQKDSPETVASDSSLTSGESGEDKVAGSVYTDGIINEIRNLVTGISSEKTRKSKSRETQESILQEIEKLAAEAYSIFRSSSSTVPDSEVLEAEEVEPPVKISSGTGSGFEIVCQGFNWESHKSGKWYMQLQEKAAELSSLGFTVVWLPPPTESIAPEGYMPKDLYNLNSRYGDINELKGLVKKFHEVGIKVLGDAVLNHRCAHQRNQNGIWNIFGGRLNWDDRAVVADDPHFQGRGNKSSGDNFHAAPNIDHSQEFVRKDLKEWLCWLRKEIGYDGWRLDFVRGFWGGYVKDYMEATEPYFAVGEYWDSLSYTYGEMDHNQDAHRQRIVDWINATNGTAGAFDVTTKGVLHSAIERCEYWRLSDEKRKPPGVVGWWPSRAVTFIENHDTGSTQGHWRFPGGKEMQGYAYILTHPGTPSVFYDHIFSHYQSEISALLSVRMRNKIHCRSAIKITKAERDVYAAIMDGKVAVKIGPGHYEPPNGPKKWSLAVEGKDYKVWETS